LFNLRKLFISYSFSIAILIPVEKYLYRFVYTRIPINKTRSAKAIIVGSGKLGTHFFEFVNKTRLLGINIVGFLDDDCFSEMRDLYIGTISDLPEILTDTSISDILIAIPSDQVDRIEYVKKISDENARRVRVIPDYFKSDSIIPLEKFLNSPLLSIRNVPLDDKELRLLKRIFDFIFSLLFMLLIASWLFPLIALLIKLSSRGPVFFKQERWGINNSRMSIDEFPQFINVLKGEMSVVGPRPHPTALNEISKNQVNHYMLRHLVKPGITGWAQVNGFRGETSDVRLMRKRVELDIWYIENWSFRLDIQIIFQTIINMLKGDRNAY
jgi:putative colanic acid biosynthesis UDP-glucose lipid carrier transferase